MCVASHILQILCTYVYSQEMFNSTVAMECLTMTLMRVRGCYFCSAIAEDLRMQEFAVCFLRSAKNLNITRYSSYSTQAFKVIMSFCNHLMHKSTAWWSGTETDWL